MEKNLCEGCYLLKLPISITDGKRCSILEVGLQDICPCSKCIIKTTCGEFGTCNDFLKIANLANGK